MTTVKISTATRARLREGASGRFRTLGDYIDYLAKEDDRRRRMEALAAAIAATPPELMDSWRRETAEWERAELEDAARLQ